MKETKIYDFKLDYRDNKYKLFVKDKQSIENIIKVLTMGGMDREVAERLVADVTTLKTDNW